MLLFAGPGQMDTARDDPDLPFVPDTERWVAAALDTVVERPEVDPERVALLGISFGGYFASRAAAHEPRVRALVANSPHRRPARRHGVVRRIRPGRSSRRG